MPSFHVVDLPAIEQDDDDEDDVDSDADIEIVVLSDVEPEDVPDELSN